MRTCTLLAEAKGSEGVDAGVAVEGGRTRRGRRIDEKLGPTGSAHQRVRVVRAAGEGVEPGGRGVRRDGGLLEFVCLIERERLVFISTARRRMGIEEVVLNTPDIGCARWIQPRDVVETRMLGVEMRGGEDKNL